MGDAAHLLAAYAITDLIACLMPGPAVATISGIALSGSLRGMAGAIAGINAGNAIWYIMIGTGLVALIDRAPMVFTLLGWAGITYLFWLGVQTWRAHAHLEAKRAREQIGAWRGFASAIAVQLSNPKALLFFTVFLPPFVNMHRPVAPQLVVLAAIGMVIEAVVLAGYGLLSYRLGALSLSAEREKRVARISGALFITIALGMALMRIGL